METNSDDDSQTDAPPDLISSIYKSMSQIIESLNTDNILINQQINKIRSELEFVCSMVAELKVDTVKNDAIVELKKKIAAINDLQKHVVDTRNMLVQTLDTNIKAIKRELSEMRATRDGMRGYIKSTVDEEIRTHMAQMDTRLSQLEQSNAVRRDSIRSEAANIAQIIKADLSDNPELLEKINAHLARLSVLC